MGGFHASLCPEEVSRYAEPWCGRGRGLWPAPGRFAERPLADLPLHQRPMLERRYAPASNLRGKRYLPLGHGGGRARLPAITASSARCNLLTATHRRRPVEDMLADIEQLRHLDGPSSSWTTTSRSTPRGQGAFPGDPLCDPVAEPASIKAAYDEDLSSCLCERLRRSADRLRSLREEALTAMSKGFNLVRGGYRQAMANLRRRDRVYRHLRLRLRHDTAESFEEALDFARGGFYMPPSTIWSRSPARRFTAGSARRTGAHADGGWTLTTGSIRWRSVLRQLRRQSCANVAWLRAALLFSPQHVAPAPDTSRPLPHHEGEGRFLGSESDAPGRGAPARRIPAGDEPWQGQLLEVN